MEIPYYQVDAFTTRPFHGNPAGVCPLPAWLADDVLQAIAAENNLSETAFLVREGDGWRLRWFTPSAEVDLCGHATLASAWVLLVRLDDPAQEVRFFTRSGTLVVARAGERLAMRLPRWPPTPCTPPAALLEGLGHLPLQVLRARDYLAIYGHEADVRALRPDADSLATLDAQGVIATAPGEGCDFVSRYFAPAVGVPEDPVTGSAHCTLTPYWARRLGRTQLRAVQVSARGGELDCEDGPDAVTIVGSAVLFLEGTIRL